MKLEEGEYVPYCLVHEILGGHLDDKKGIKCRVMLLKKGVIKCCPTCMITKERIELVDIND